MSTIIKCETDIKHQSKSRINNITTSVIPQPPTIFLFPTYNMKMSCGVLIFMLKVAHWLLTTFAPVICGQMLVKSVSLHVEATLPDHFQVLQRESMQKVEMRRDGGPSIRGDPLRR